MSGKMRREFTGREVADELDVTPRTVQGWAKSGCPHTSSREGNRYDLAEVVAWMRAENVTGEPGRPAAALSPDRRAARLRKELALGEKYELANEKERALLVRAAEVRERWGANLAKAKQVFEAIPRAAAPECEGQTAAGIQTVLDRHVYAVLVHLSGGQGGRL